MNKQAQHEFWNAFVHFREQKTNHPFSFSQNFVKECLYFRDISKDLDRTLPEYERFSTTEG